MMSELDTRRAVLDTWKTGNRLTTYLLERLPDPFWGMKVPGYSQKTVRMIGGHIHNTRCMWIKKVGDRFDIAVPEPVDRYRVGREHLVEALDRSSEQVLLLLRKGLDAGGKLPGFQPDVVHFMGYLLAHEAHHRGQIVMVARQLGQPLPDGTAYGLWHWSKRHREAGDTGQTR